MEDGFVECPHCGSRLCYAQKIEDVETWSCLACGFTSTTQMKQGSDIEVETSDKNPNIYKDLKFVDKDGYVWYPSVVNVPGKGVVYVDGCNSKDWEWVSVKVRPVSKREKRMKIYKGKEYLLDMSTLCKFGKDGGYMDALLSIGAFEE